jgi:hypothetical protein
MSANVLEPRRLRESAERPSSIEGRLARQLRILSAHAPTRQLRRYSVLPRRRRYLLMFVRAVSVATIVLAVSGAAMAMATYVVRQVWPGPTADHRRKSPTVLPAAKRGKGHPQRDPSPAEPVAPALQKPEATSAGVANPAQPPATLPTGARSLAARQSARPPAESYRAPVEAPKVPLVENLEPARSPWLPGPSPTVASPPVWLAPSPSAPARPGAGAAVRAPADGVTREAEVLRQALAALRRDHDARRALSLLDDYDRRFGRGALAQEADATRAQAWLQLGDNSRALALLDRLPLGQQGHTGELQVVRGELRSLSGRCRDALIDFDAVLRGTAGYAPTEVARALFGRASCRARTGDAVGAEADRQRYLKEFPQGPAAGQLSSRP